MLFKIGFEVYTTIIIQLTQMNRSLLEVKSFLILKSVEAAQHTGKQLIELRIETKIQ